MNFDGRSGWLAGFLSLDRPSGWLISRDASEDIVEGRHLQREEVQAGGEIVHLDCVLCIVSQLFPGWR